MVHLVPQFLVVARAIFLLTVSVVSSKRIRYSINRRPQGHQGLGSDNDCGFSLYKSPAFQPKTGARATCEKLVASIGLPGFLLTQKRLQLHLELLEFDIEAERIAQLKLNPSIPYVIPFKNHQNSNRFKKHFLYCEHQSQLWSKAWNHFLDSMMIPYLSYLPRYRTLHWGSVCLQRSLFPVVEWSCTVVPGALGK